jgi:hypothetical protein
MPTVPKLSHLLTLLLIGSMIFKVPKQANSEVLIVKWKINIGGYADIDVYIHITFFYC